MLYFPKSANIKILFEFLRLTTALTFLRKIILLLSMSISPCFALIIYSFPFESLDEYEHFQ